MSAVTAVNSPRRTRAIAVVALTGVALSVSACGSNPRAGQWVDRSGRPISRALLETSSGGRHCKWESVTFLAIQARLLGIHRPGALIYARDPDGVLPLRFLAARYGPIASVPRAAEDTGFRLRHLHLWVVPSRINEAVYVVQGESIERWPRTLGGCA